ncbi:MAG: arginine--tRNA ligase [Minisyncoccia bacterium]
MKKQLEKSISQALKKLSVAHSVFSLEHPDDLNHGDYSTNVALVYSKDLKTSPRQSAEKILVELQKTKIPNVSKIEIAGPGFINFFLMPDFFTKEINKIAKIGKNYGANKSRAGEKIMIEYTDPNAFKQFHIGHLMANSVGETISRLLDFSGAKVIRACYSGDIGLHVAKAIWGYQNLDKKIVNKETKARIYEEDKEILTHDDELKFWGLAYAFGSSEYDGNETAKSEIDELNRKLYSKPEGEIKRLYDQGREISYRHLNEIYTLLGTKFNIFFFESEVQGRGLFLVNNNLEDGIFEKSDGAIVFRGENYGLHTRVFVNKLGLPTYEAKELALNIKKFELEKDLKQSIIVTAHEQSDYFKVVLKALSLINPNVAEKTKHVAHGMLRFSTGKMSSRKGNIVTGESMIEDVEALVTQKIKDRELNEKEKKEITEKVAVGAIRYSILKQQAGSDIIFDFDKSISFEGDSGPYLQYTTVRAKSILQKAKQEGLKFGLSAKILGVKNTEETCKLEKMLYRFPEVVERSQKEYSSHYLATFLTEIASEFNSYYANHKIVEKGEKKSLYRLQLTRSVSIVLENGLNLLGIEVPVKM